MRIIKEQCLGLVIDIQEKLFPHISGHKELAEKVTVLVNGLKLLSVPVIATEQYRKGLGPTLDSIQVLFDDFEPLEKMTFSCCDDHDINRAIRDSGKRTVIICGIESHVCVLQTAIDLIEKGYQPVVVADAVSSRKEFDRSVALERMRSEGVIISTTESILFELARVSGTDTFKAISKLVK